MWAESATKSGQAARVPETLATLDAANNPEAARLMAEAYEAQGKRDEAIKFYRRVYFLGAGTESAKIAEVKLASFSQPVTATSPRTCCGTKLDISDERHAGDASATVESAIGLA